jgi:hypothetical protein
VRLVIDTNILITVDKRDLRELQRFEGIRIITVPDFLSPTRRLR